MKRLTHWRGKAAAALLAACAWLAAGHAALAQPTGAERPREALVKAAFLHKFFSFVEWPEGTFPRPDTPVRIGVMGDEEVWQDLLELSRDRGRDGRPVVPVLLVPGAPVNGIHILYLKAPSVSRMSEWLAAVPEGVLTVADADSAHPKGSVMSFYLEDGRVRFGLSLEAAARQRLRVSSRLLAVAKRIQGAVDIREPLVWGWRPVALNSVDQ